MKIALVSIFISLVAIGVSLYVFLRPIPEFEKKCNEQGGTYYEGRDKEGKVKQKWCELNGKIYTGKRI